MLMIRFWILVAIGTIIADTTPRRSVRALLTHTAPTLDSGFKAKLGIRMQHARRRQPSLGSFDASGPRQAARSGCAFSAHATSIDLPVPEIA